MALTSVPRLSPYEILAPIGKGRMGEVYTRLERTVAIKVPLEHLAESPEPRLGRRAAWDLHTEPAVSFISSA